MRLLLAVVIVIGVGPAIFAQSVPRKKSTAQADLRPVSVSRSESEKAARETSAILVSKCIGCHGPEKKKGGLDLSRRQFAISGGESGPAIVVGKADESLIVEKVAGGEMPPNGALSKEQIATVRTWVESGATYLNEPLTAPRAGADWWSLRPVRLVAPTRVKGLDVARIRTPIDAFILAGLEASGLRLAQEANRVELIRRVTFDLTGLPPTPEQVDAFLADPDPMAYEKLVDRLLASPHYGERWGRHWLDVVRFGESEGYETNLPRASAWPYRDYVIRAFNRDTPFPRFVLEQLAGDTLNEPAPPLPRPEWSGRAPESAPTQDRGIESRVDWLTQAATGFLVGGSHDIVGNQTVEGMLQQRADDLDDMITATGTAFLGVTIQCARCHDHKFDPIRQADYYGFQAIFAGVNHSARDVPAPDSEGRRNEAREIATELARIDRRLDDSEPMAHPDRDTPVRAMVNPRRNVERFAPVRARMVRLTILATDSGTEPCVDELEVYTSAEGKGASPRNVARDTAGGRASASSVYPGNENHKIAHLNDGRYGNGRSWISQSAGRGVVTITWPEPATIDRVVWGRDRDGAYLDRLATQYYVEVALEPNLWQVVASSLDRQTYGSSAAAAAASEPSPERGGLLAKQTELRNRLTQLGATIKIYAGTFSQPAPTYLLVRGDPTRKGPEARPSGIACIRPTLVLDSTAPEAQRRAGLARWIADPGNPLSARVMVNRIWHYHFGRGIVTTPSDFGFNGGPPSHPELLDWLASTYINGGWRLKPIHRLIVLSSTYRQSSRLDPKAESVDRDNRLLWRFSPRRLEAESIRDAILATSGRLDTRMGGPGYNIWEKNTNYVAVYKPRVELGADDFRRMVYQFKPRSQPDPTFSAFDCPEAALVVPRRNISTTALQALNLLNSRFVIQQAESFADRLRTEAGPDPARQAERGFHLAFGRLPSILERDAAVKLIVSHGTPAFCRALYNANEFVYVP